MPSKDMELRMAMDRPPRSRRPRSLLPAIAVAILLAVGVSSADASSAIEGVWSFNGGQIAIQPSSGGKFTGTVVVETKFAECTHPVGQPIWTEMTLQSDGSYWGLHLWYESKSTSCVENTERGHTAWRVLEGSGGSHFLRVCFSSPTPNGPQPHIAPSGAPNSPSEYATYGVTYGCADSALTAPLPSTSGTAGSPKEHLSLPSAKKCLSLRLFQIHLPDPKYDPLKRVSVTIKGRKIATVRKGKYVVATINLKGLPKGVFTVDIHATTILGHHLSAARTFHTCIKKASHKKTEPKRGK